MLFCRLCAEQHPAAQLKDLALDLKLKAEIMDSLSLFHINTINFSDKSFPETVCSDCCRSMRFCINFLFKIGRSQDVLRKHIDEISGSTIVPETCINDVKEERLTDTENDGKIVSAFDKNEESGSTIVPETCINDVKEERLSDTENDGTIVSAFDKNEEIIIPTLIEPVIEKKKPLRDQIKFEDDCVINTELYKLGVSPTQAENEKSKPDSNNFDEYTGESGPSSGTVLPSTDNHVPKKKKRKLSLEALTCNICNKVIYGQSKYNAHKLIHKERTRDIHCHECGKSFFTLYCFKKHQYKTHKSDPQECTICKKVVMNKSRLGKHMKMHSGFKFECDICHMKFNRKDKIATHMIIHSNIFPYLCNICGQGFQFKRPLKTHENAHNKVRPYECTICGSKFTKKGNCNSHMKRYHGTTKLAKTFRTPLGRMPIDKTGKLIESNNKPSNKIVVDEKTDFTCDGCGKIFEAKDTLTEHKRIAHDKYASQVCKICNAKLANWPVLVIHMKKHRGEIFECDHCHKTFNTKIKIRRHMLVHAPFKCSHCGKRFKLNKTFKLHVCKYRREKKLPPLYASLYYTS